VIRSSVQIADHFASFLSIAFKKCISNTRTVTGRFSRSSVKWLTPTKEWIHYIWEQSNGHPVPDQSWNLDSNARSI